MNPLKEEYYRIYSFCLTKNLSVSKSQEAAKLFIENLQGEHSLYRIVTLCLKKMILSISKKVS